MRRSAALSAKINVSQIETYPGSNILKPTSEWKKCFDKNKKDGTIIRRAFWHQFLTISNVAHPLLNLPAGKIPSASKVFSQLKIDPQKLTDLDPCKHVKLLETMKAMGMDKTKVHGMKPGMDPYAGIYDAVSRLIKIMPRALRGTTEPNIDSFAGLFLTMCGFADGKLVLATQVQSPFCMFGCRCESKPEHFVVITPNNDLVLIIEDGTHKTEANKHLFVGGKQPKFDQYHGYVGQVIGEMLMAASLNARLPVPPDNKIPDDAPKKKMFHSIFAFRFVGLHLTAFQLSVSAAQMDALAKGHIPSRKLLLRTSVKDCVTDPGWDTTVQPDRYNALALAAAVLKKVSK